MCRQYSAVCHCGFSVLQPGSWTASLLLCATVLKASCFSVSQPGSWNASVAVQNSLSTDTITFAFNIQHSPSGLEFTDYDLVTDALEPKVSFQS